MRKFTKSILALALLFMGLSNASAQDSEWVEIYKITYSDYQSFPFFVMGYEPTWENGIMVDDPVSQGVAGWHQYFIADGIPTAHADKTYKVKALVKCSNWFGFNINMGWGWNAGESVGVFVNLPFSEDFVEVEWEYTGIEGQSCNLVAQPWSGDNKIEWKELRVYEPGVPITFTDILTNGDLEGDVNLHFTVKEQRIEGPYMSLIEDGAGVDGSRGIRVQSMDDVSNEDGGTDYDTQFFLSLPKKLKSGTKFKISFDYRASQDAASGTFWQAAPGEYVHWDCIGGPSFTEEWQTFEKTGTVSKNNGQDIDPYTIAFNLATERSATTYYFDNFKFEVSDNDLPNLEDAPALDNLPYPTEDPAFTIGESGYATFGYPYPVVFGDDIEVYAATLNDDGYLTLIQIDGAAADTGVILKGDPGDYTATVQAVPAPEKNDLKVSDGQVAGNGSSIYALANKSNGVGFYLVANGETIPQGKAYLDVDNLSEAPLFIGFDGGTTSISELNVKNNAEGVYYNLAGQRVAQPTKGLYIVNGKKVIK